MARITLEDQIGEAIESFAYIVRENAEKVDRGTYTAEHGLHRQKCREAILATLKWLQEHREEMIAVARLAKARESAPADDAGVETGDDG